MSRPRSRSMAGSRQSQRSVRVVVCAWCAEYRLPHATARPSERQEWQPVSHAFTWAATGAGLASYGICPRCRDAERRKVDATPRAAA